MRVDRFPIGQEMDVTYPNFKVSLTLLSVKQLRFEIKEGPFARVEVVDIQIVPLGNSILAVSWQEMDGATVTNVQDYDRGLVHSFATLPSGEFIRMSGPISATRPAKRVSDDRPERNKALVIEAITSLFQRRDASGVERHYAADYIQHNPSIPQGRDALQALVAGLSQDVYYESGLIVAEGDLVAIHGRIHGWGRTAGRSRYFPDRRRQAGRALGRSAGRGARDGGPWRRHDVRSRGKGASGPARTAANALIDCPNMA